MPTARPRGGRPKNSRKKERKFPRRLFPAAHSGPSAMQQPTFSCALDPPSSGDVPRAGIPRTRDKSVWRPPSSRESSQGQALRDFLPCPARTELLGGLDNALGGIDSQPSPLSTQDNYSRAPQSPAQVWSPAAGASSHGNHPSRHAARAKGRTDPRQTPKASPISRRCYPHDITEIDTWPTFKWDTLNVFRPDGFQQQAKAIIDPSTKKNFIRERLVGNLNCCPVLVPGKSSRPVLSRLVGLVQPHTFLEVAVQATANPGLIRILPMYVFDEREDTETKGDWDIILAEPLEDGTTGERETGLPLEQEVVVSPPYDLPWGGRPADAPGAYGVATAGTSASTSTDPPSDHEIPTSTFTPSSYEQDEQDVSMWSLGASACFTNTESVSTGFGTSPYIMKSPADGTSGTFAELEAYSFGPSLGDSNLLGSVGRGRAGDTAPSLPNSDDADLPMVGQDPTNPHDPFEEFD